MCMTRTHAVSDHTTFALSPGAAAVRGIGSAVGVRVSQEGRALRSGALATNSTALESRCHGQPSRYRLKC